MELTFSSIFDLATVCAFLAIFFGKVMLTTARDVNPFALERGKGRRRIAIEVAFVTSVAMLMIEVTLEAFGRPIRLFFEIAYIYVIDSFIPSSFGYVAVVVAFVLLVRAYRDLGAAWRVGTDSQHSTHLVTSGIYAWTRNPIYLFFMLWAWGMALIHPSLIFVVTAIFLTVTVHLITREEEAFLLQAFAEQYAAYRTHTPRFLPHQPRERLAGTPVDVELYERATPREWLRRLVTRPPEGRAGRDVILWWERRRLIYNAFVLAFGLLFTAIESIWDHDLPLFGLWVVTILVVTANIWYTGGWIVELFIRQFIPERRLLWFGPVMFRLGVIFSWLFSALVLLFVTTLFIP